jgi:hypothetical protein
VLPLAKGPLARPALHASAHHSAALPLAQGPLARLGAPERYIVASGEQQKLLPHLLPQFVSPLCVEHPKVGVLFASRWACR